jgi:hypothetical protein
MEISLCDEMNGGTPRGQAQLMFSGQGDLAVWKLKMLSGQWLRLRHCCCVANCQKPRTRQHSRTVLTPSPSRLALWQEQGRPPACTGSTAEPTGHDRMRSARQGRGGEERRAALSDQKRCGRDLRAGQGRPYASRVRRAVQAVRGWGRPSPQDRTARRSGGIQ